ncbi:MAG TPA: DUF1269 domain-containing protein [Gemmatimonadaceae bacterium]|nr:DUF1269 domain-containing protein [Gemmatimonadaceae bacterium]
MAELMVVGFEGKHRATEVLNQLEDMNESFEIDLRDAVAVYRTDDGKLRVDQSAQPTTREGAAWGAMLGGLIGAALLAPFTAGASAAAAATAVGAGLFTGGVTGATIGADDADTWKKTYGISDDFVKEVGGMVQPGQSAVFVLAGANRPAAVAEKFRGYGGKVLRTTLPAESAAKFEKLMTPPTAR